MDTIKMNPENPENKVPQDPLEVFLNEKRVVTFRGNSASAVTILAYENSLKRFQKWMGKPILEANREEILGFLKDRKSEWPRLQTFFRWAEEQEYITKAPLKGIKIRPNLPAPKQAGYKTHPQSELVKLLGGCVHWREKIAISLYGFLGLRAEELIGVNRSDIEKDYKSIKIIGKGNKPATIPLDPISKELLRLYFKNVLYDCPGGSNGIAQLPLLPKIRPYPLGKVIGKPRAALEERDHYYFDQRATIGSIRESIERVYERVGLPLIKRSKLHRLRHSAITNAIQSGMSPIAVSRRLARHSQISTTLDIYCHPDEEWIEKEWEKAIKKMPKPKDFE